MWRTPSPTRRRAVSPARRHLSLASVELAATVIGDAAFGVD
jgi:hypothetical protein